MYENIFNLWVVLDQEPNPIEYSAKEICDVAF
jgi:hypothetical protein